MELNKQNYNDLLQEMKKHNEIMELFFKGYAEHQNQLKCQSINSVVLPLNYEIQGESHMKGITKRKDNRYMIRKMINGERKTLYAKTMQEAKIILKKFQNGKIKFEKQERIKNYTFGEYSKEWLELYKKPFINSKSYSAIKSNIKCINQIFENYKLKDITSNEIQIFLNKMPINRKKERVIIYFNSVLQKATDTGLIPRNPFVAVIKDKKVKSKNDAYTFAEQQLILQLFKNSDIEHEIMIYLMCGCRPNELPSKNQFDFENNIIHIYGTKNDNALHREIEMSEQFSKYMKEYLKKNNIQAEKYVANKFIKVCKEAQINNPLLYRLRHTFATNHFALGTQPKIVQHWMGHASIKVTLDTYTDIDKTLKKDKLKTLYNNFYYIP